MGDIRVNEDVLFVLDRVSGMEQSTEEYRAEPTKNEVEAIEIMRHYCKNVTPQYCPIICNFIIFLFTYLLCAQIWRSNIDVNFCSIKRSCHILNQNSPRRYISCISEKIYILSPNNIHISRVSRIFHIYFFSPS